MAGSTADARADAQLAAERTSLSWRRTALAALVAALLLLRAALVVEEEILAVLPAGGCLSLLALGAVAYRRSRRLRAGGYRDGSTAIRWSIVAVLITATCAGAYTLLDEPDCAPATNVEKC